MTDVVTRFSPWLMPREVADAIYVSRHPFIETLVQRAAEAASGVNRHHTLVIGPRGSGKTTLFTMASYAISDLIDAGTRLRVVHVPEEAWQITSFRQLLQAIQRGCSTGQPGATEAELTAWLEETSSADGVIVVFLENLDRVLTQIGLAGQQKLRHLLQTSGSLLLFASTTTTDQNLASTSKPFYNFFTTLRLEPLTMDQARQLLVAVAGLRDDTALVAWLGTDAATVRLNVIQHLAGSQPRLWASLANVMTIDSLESLTSLLRTGFADLLPSYLDQLAHLAPQQRLIVTELAQAGHPLHVAELAIRVDMEPKSVARVVGELKNSRWVAPVRTRYDHLLDRRRTYYELADPMTCFALRLADNYPLDECVDFLIQWFSRDLSSAWSGDPAFLGVVDDALASLSKPPADGYMTLSTVVRHALEDQGPPDSAAIAALFPDNEAIRQDSSVDLLATRIEVRSHAATCVDGSDPDLAAQWTDRSLRLDADIVSLLGYQPSRSVTARFLGLVGRVDEAAMMSLAL